MDYAAVWRRELGLDGADLNRIKNQLQQEAALAWLESRAKYELT